MKRELVLSERNRSRRRVLTILCLWLFVCGMFTACGQEEQPANQEILASLTPTPAPTATLTPTPTKAPTLTPTPTEVVAEPLVEETPQDPVGMVKSRLTGLWIPEESAKQRPFAVMINNIQVASPQSGLSAADILYEVLVEYGITRLMAVFETADVTADTSTRIGSIRSARHYYVPLAEELDAIYVHFGGTSYAYDRIHADKADEIDGIKGGLANMAFSRDNTIPSPHNVFLDFSVMLNAVNKSSMRTTVNEEKETVFSFYDEDTTPKNGQQAEKVTVRFSQSVQPYLTYDKESGEYIRYQFGALHKDCNNDQPLSFKNILIQYAKQENIDKNGYLTIELAGAEGDGFYVTNGVAVPIVWKRNEAEHECHYYDTEGNELCLNIGKTYGVIYPDNYRSGVVFE